MNDLEKALIIFIPGFPKDENDSTCLPAQQFFIKALNRLYPNTPIIIFSFQYPYYEGEYRWHNNLVISFGGQNKGGLSRRFLWMRVRKKFSKLRNEYRIAGILSFWCGECAFVGKRLAKKYKIKHYCWLMGQDAKKDNNFVRRIRPVPGELIAISDFTKHEFVKNHDMPPGHVIPLGVDPALVVAARFRDIDLLGAGSLIPLKQFDLFISIVRDVTNLYPRVTACICGKGPEEQRLQELIETNGLSHHVRLLGELSHQELLLVMGRSKVFLHTSSFEGFSGVCLEALAAGAQVVSFLKPMQEEIKHWHHVEDTGMMKEKLYTLLGRPIDPQPVMPYSVDRSAKTVMGLFGF